MLHFSSLNKLKYSFQMELSCDFKALIDFFVAVDSRLLYLCHRSILSISSHRRYKLVIFFCLCIQCSFNDWNRIFVGMPFGRSLLFSRFKCKHAKSIFFASNFKWYWNGLQFQKSKRGKKSIANSVIQIFLFLPVCERSFVLSFLILFLFIEKSSLSSWWRNCMLKV